MKNIELPNKMHLGRLLDELRYGNFVIPDFQREFEWYPWDVAELLKSILEDYYIGTLLLWKASKENLKNLKCEDIYGFEGKPDPAHIVLDGQQRLSALYYAFFAPQKAYPKRKTRCYFFLRLENLLNGNFNESVYYEWGTKAINQLLENTTQQFEQKILPLNIFGETRQLIKWMEKYEVYWSGRINPSVAKKERDKLEDLLTDYLDSYDISYIELDRNIEISKVCDIFTRINSTGIELTIFDLLNALLRPKDIGLKDLWRNISETKELAVVESEKMRVYLLQTMSILLQGYCAPKYLYYLVPDTTKPTKNKKGTSTTIKLVKDKSEFLALWKSAVEKTVKGIQIIQNNRDFGAINANFIPYPTMIPIFSALNFEKSKEEYVNKKDAEEKIKKWYWASIFTKNYSSSVESQMQKDWTDVKSWFLNDLTVPSVIKQSEFEVNNLNLKKEISQGSAIYKAIFNILILNGARDWATHDLPEYSMLEDHHIIPKSWGKKNQIRGINTILNRTPLADSTNKKIISDKLPNRYLLDLLKNMESKEELYGLMKTHLISRKAVDILMRKKFCEKDFDEFIEEREKTILEEIRKLLGVNINKQTGLFQPNKPFSNKILIKNLILNSYKYIDWVDRYFSAAGLEMIAQAIIGSNKTDLDHIRILTSIDKVDFKFRGLFKDLREELKNLKVNIEMKVIVEKKIKSMIHDRWFITEGKIFNIPSTDTMAVGQYSEIKETENCPPFEEWWDTCLDIVYDWNEINKSIAAKTADLIINLVCQGKGAVAKGVYYNDGRMKVLKSSTALVKNAPAFIKHNYKKTKDALIADKLLKPKGKYYIFVKDYVFDSPSAAAAVILGRSASGPEEWKNEAGKTLKEIV